MTVQMLAIAYVLAELLVTGGSAPLRAGKGDKTRQPSAATVEVRDRATGRPLLNAEVTDTRSGEHRFTDERGQTRIAWPGNGRLNLRVRQIGYRLASRDVTRDDQGATATNAIVIELDRVIYVLPTVVAKNTTQCAATSDSTSSALSAAILEQLRSSAERYENFRKSYPFTVKARRRTGTLGPDGKLRQLREQSDQVNSDNWGDAYTPGRLIERTAFGFSVPILFLSSLADPVFWRHHCFAARGVESLDGRRVILLDFLPGPSVRQADWAGTAFVDSANSLLRRIEFRLTGLRKDERPRRLEGYTTFRSPSPNIVLPDSTVAGWWRREIVNDEWGMPDVVQSVTVESLTYRKRGPAGDPGVRR